jgi:threonine synthase
VLAPFFEGSDLESELGAICRDAFDFPLPLKPLAKDGELAVLELFHGPTAAFKDVGARFLAALMERALSRSADSRPLTILVATSGDTGGAVAAAFHRRRGIRVGVLFPKGQVSPRQQHQLTCWGDNVRAFEVDGAFDACQALLKAAFMDSGLQRRHRLTAANSINIGRLLPQVAYHAAASLWHWRRHGTSAGSIVPSGNLGNGVACVWARAMGLPVREIVLAVNANRTIPDFLATGQWQPRPSVATLASAMDVGDPSNMERLMALYPAPGELASRVHAVSIDDAGIRAAIRAEFARSRLALCPHSAAGLAAYRRLPADDRRRGHWIVTATAHPAKFPETVEPLLGRRVEPPPALAALLGRPSRKTRIAAEIGALAEQIGEAACTH